MNFKFELGERVAHITDHKFGFTAMIVIARGSFEGIDGSLSNVYLVSSPGCRAFINEYELQKLEAKKSDQ